MSMTSVWVRASDNRWYKDPVVRGEDLRWFICFDDDDPVEFVMRTDGERNIMRLRRLAESCLRLAGIRAAIDSDGRLSSRLFGDDFYPAVSFWINLQAPPPASLIIPTRVESTRPSGEGVYYPFAN